MVGSEKTDPTLRNYEIGRWAEPTLGVQRRCHGDSPERPGESPERSALIRSAVTSVTRPPLPKGEGMTTLRVARGRLRLSTSGRIPRQTLSSPHPALPQSKGGGNDHHASRGMQVAVIFLAGQSPRHRASPVVAKSGAGDFSSRPVTAPLGHPGDGEERQCCRGVRARIAVQGTKRRLVPRIWSVSNRYSSSFLTACSA